MPRELGPAAPRAPEPAARRARQAAPAPPRSTARSPRCPALPPPSPPAAAAAPVAPCGRTRGRRALAVAPAAAGPLAAPRRTTDLHDHGLRGAARVVGCLCAGDHRVGARRPEAMRHRRAARLTAVPEAPAHREPGGRAAADLRFQAHGRARPRATRPDAHAHRQQRALVHADLEIVARRVDVVGRVEVARPPDGAQEAHAAGVQPDQRRALCKWRRAREVGGPQDRQRPVRAPDRDEGDGVGRHPGQLEHAPERDPRRVGDRLALPAVPAQRVGAGGDVLGAAQLRLADPQLTPGNPHHHPGRVRGRDEHQQGEQRGDERRCPPRAAQPTTTVRTRDVPASTVPEST